MKWFRRVRLLIPFPRTATATDRASVRVCVRLLPRKAEHVVLLGPFVAFAQSRHVAVIHGQLGKSPFDRECVVGLGGLELLTKRLLPRHE